MSTPFDLPPDPDPPDALDGLLITADLLSRARTGERAAQHELFERFAPVLQRLLHARLPARARGLMDTDDLVQEVHARAFARLEHFDYRGPGSFWSYLRRIGLNYVREVMRREEDSPVPLNGSSLDGEDSHVGPVSDLLQKERFFLFETALDVLSDVQRRAVLMRLELGMSFATIAEECALPSPDAARMTVNRALTRLVERMSHDGIAE